MLIHKLKLCRKIDEEKNETAKAFRPSLHEEEAAITSSFEPLCQEVPFIKSIQICVKISIKKSFLDLD